MRFTILTLFPELFQGFLECAIVGRAVKRGEIRVELTQIRDHAPDRHRQVDDTPYGGGPGMVMKPDVLAAAVAAVQRQTQDSPPRVVLLSPQGRPFTQADARRLASLEHLLLVCGRYEGVDERFSAACVDEELSLGDFVLTGGEVAAMAVVEAVTRLLPGVLGDDGSAAADSFGDGLLDCPHYTRPPRWTPSMAGEGAKDGGEPPQEGLPVPAVLLSGNHPQVAAWRRRQALLRTLIRRPDLLAGARLERAEKRLLEALKEDLEAMDPECGPPDPTRHPAPVRNRMDASSGRRPDAPKEDMER